MNATHRKLICEYNPSNIKCRPEEQWGLVCYTLSHRFFKQAMQWNVTRREGRAVVLRVVNATTAQELLEAVLPKTEITMQVLERRDSGFDLVVKEQRGGMKEMLYTVKPVKRNRG